MFWSLPPPEADSLCDWSDQGRQLPRPLSLSLIHRLFEIRHAADFRSSARAGSSIWKVEPLPKVDSTQMRPPCISTICLAMASPRPVPPLALVLELST